MQIDLLFFVFSGHFGGPEADIKNYTQIWLSFASDLPDPFPASLSIAK